MGAWVWVRVWEKESLFKEGHVLSWVVFAFVSFVYGWGVVVELVTRVMNGQGKTEVSGHREGNTLLLSMK